MRFFAIAAFAAMSPFAAASQEAIDPKGQTTEIALDQAVTLRVKEVRRLEDKGVMQLLFEVANTGGSDTSLMEHGIALAFGLGDIAIVDFGGRKQYKMGYANGCLCSSFPERDGGVVRAGGTEEFWAWFGLPDEGVTTVAVQFPGLQPIMNVPVL